MPAGKHFTLRLRGVPKNLRAIRRVTELYLEENGDRTGDVQIVVNEAFGNAIQHAYDLDAPGYVTIVFRREDDLLCLSVHDDGRGLAAAQPETSGLGAGLPLIKALATTMKLSEPEEGGTTLEATFQLAASA